MCKSYKVIFINVNTPILILIAQETKLFNLFILKNLVIVYLYDKIGFISQTIQ